MGFLSKDVGIDLGTANTLVSAAATHAHAGVHLMGGTGQGPQHPFCVLHAVGLAEHFPVHVHHRVAADDHGVRVVLCHRQEIGRAHV